MKLYVRILLMVLCAALLAGMPLFLSSPALLQEAETEIVYDEDEEEESLDFGRIFLMVTKYIFGSYLRRKKIFV